MSPSLFTIGHSNHPLERFVELLTDHAIEVLVDVRSKPFSRFCPHFTRDALRVGVESAGIAYQFMGRPLGGKPDDSTMYADGKPLYDRMAEQGEFKRGIRELIGLAEAQRVAIMCSEEDPSMCHRRFLIAPALLEEDVAITHIRGDGTVATEAELREREHKTDDDQLSLFGE